MQYKITKKSVNSQTLFDEINNFVVEAIETLGIHWDSEIHRESFVDIIEDWLYEKADEGKITQMNVICDERNNQLTAIDPDAIKLEVTYKQKNCVNTTRIIYEIVDTGENIIDELLQFYVTP